MDGIDIRLPFLVVVFVVGMAAGFMCHLSRGNPVEQTAQRNVETKQPATTGRFITTGLRLPEIDEDTGKCKSLLRADKGTWDHDRCALVLTNPVLESYGKDGVTVTSRTTGDHGEVIVRPGKGSLGVLTAIRISGHTKVRSFRED
jgi:hypothetical protein